MTNKNLQEFMEYYNNVIINVKGWFFPIDIMMTYILMKEAQHFSGDICELGVAFGKSAIALSMCRNEHEKLHLYDMYEAEDLSLDVVKENIQKYGNPELVDHNVCDLMKLEQKDIKGDFLRFLHIDACHLHKAVLNDLNNFNDRMLYGGIIVVDDYNDPEYPGINTAVTQFCLQDNNWGIFAIGQNKAYICNKEYSDGYIQFLATYIHKAVPELSLNITEFMDRLVLQVGSRSGIMIEQIMNILDGKEELKYT